MDPQIACTLSAADYATRAEEAADLARQALRSPVPITGGARLTFEARAETERRLRAFVAAEAECCPFLRMDVRPVGDALVLDVTGPPEAAPVIAQLFA